MGAVSLLGDILDRLIENGAQVIENDHIRYVKTDSQLSPKGEELEELAREAGMTRTGLIAQRKWLQQMIKTNKTRLSQEMALVYTLNAARDEVLSTRYMTKAEAVVLARIVPGELLDLDAVYGGLMVRGLYVLVSDQALVDGLKRFEPADLLNGLLAERSAA